MAYLYVTTDSYEAKTLVEGPDRGQKFRHNYHEIEMKQGEELAKRIGFNPMTSVEMNRNVSVKELRGIATKLVKEGLYIATEINGTVEQYLPKECRSRVREINRTARQHNFRYLTTFSS